MFDLKIAQDLARMSALAYQPPIDIWQSLRDEFDVTAFEFLDSQTIHTQGFLAANAEHAYLVFRGTEAPTDIAVDLWFRKRVIDQGKVHEGFWLALDSVWDQILASLETPDFAGKPLYVAGHSLGGALALLAAFRLHLTQKEVAGLYTYGQPRVVNGPLERFIEKQLEHHYFRIVNETDIVVQLPFFFVGYRHVGGKFTHLDKQGQMHTKSTRHWWKKGYVVKFGLQTLMLTLQSAAYWEWLLSRFKSTQVDATMLRRQALKEILFGVKDELITDHGINLYCQKLKGVTS